MNYVITETRGKIGYITLNKVDRHNSLTLDFLIEIRSAFMSFQENLQIDVIILKANGKTFSTGGDVLSFYNNINNIKEYSESLVGTLNKLIMTMIDCHKPIITAVNGIVTGGSMGLILASDIVIITPRTTFTPYYSTVGYSPDGGWSILLREIIGPKRTSYVLMSDSTITSKQAINWGIASKIVEPLHLDIVTDHTANRILSLKNGSIRRTKKLIWNREKVLEGLNMELKNFVEQIQTEEGISGMKDFLSSLSKKRE